MTVSKKSAWVPPVSFYFKVVFQWGSQKTTASFIEVSGLEEEMLTKTIQPLGDDGGQILVTGEIKHNYIVLQRPLESIDKKITRWVKQCFSFMVGHNKIRPCLLIISLLDAKGHPSVSWVCTQAFPVKWSLSPLKSDKSDLSIETLTLTYKTLQRRN